MSQNGNPLIGESKGDTIERTYEFVEWLLIQAGHGGATHPGMVAQLRLVLDGIGSLRDDTGGEKN